MRSGNTVLRAELGAVLKELPVALRELTDGLRRDAGELWAWQSPGKSDRSGSPRAELSRDAALESICDAIEAIKYDDGQDAHESRIAPGIVAVPHEIAGLADEVNRLKRALATVLVKMQGRTEEGVIDVRTGERGPRPLREVALEAFYFRRLHHWQATRELVVLRTKSGELAAPDYVGFTWSRCRDVRRTSREKLIVELEERRATAEDTLFLDRDLEMLRRLPSKEPLATVRPGHTKPVANVAWPAVDGESPERAVRAAVLPLLMVGKRLPERLRKLPLTPAEKNARLARSDVEIESKPILQTIPVYRYLAGLRTGKRQSAA